MEDASEKAKMKRLDPGRQEAFSATSSMAVFADSGKSPPPSGTFSVTLLIASITLPVLVVTSWLITLPGGAMTDGNAAPSEKTPTPPATPAPKSAAMVEKMSPAAALAALMTPPMDPEVSMRK